MVLPPVEGRPLLRRFDELACSIRIVRPHEPIAIVDRTEEMAHPRLVSKHLGPDKKSFDLVRERLNSLCTDRVL